ncbi:DUF2695 domain-containing protein [Arsenicicoccus sp. oral taxon 190]|uniref:DUF2695 domain-containing protein n=1 Tax=Arsenicicoccus sp. oral taxon 190 TaxID=1658671 RepID=UPI00067DF404|nr:DUF2695 domain-containing protein [Arsenicicoccus sp. oral taxon 190]
MTATSQTGSAIVLELMGVRAQECVVCYVGRMVDRFGCDGTWRWVETWREQRAPRASRLERRMQARGAGCDCEVHLRGYEVDPRLLAVAWDGPIGAVCLCLGVRAGSTQPCGLWRIVQRSWWTPECHPGVTGGAAP